MKRWQHQRWVREVALPELRQLAEAGGLGQGAETVAAYRAAVALEKDLAGDPEFARILSQVSIETSIDTTPPGATVYAKSYEEPEAPWELVGTTPVSRRRVPFAPLRFKVEKPGYETLYRAAFPAKVGAQSQVPLPGAIAWPLDPEGTTPEGMTWIDASSGAPRALSSGLPRFLIDRHEVTNRQFKAFVDAGGYRDRQFWTVAFVKDGRPIDWDTAMKAFVDRTGRPGPSTWEGGTYPDGQEEFPVTGRELVRGRGVRGLRRQATADRRPLGGRRLAVGSDGDGDGVAEQFRRQGPGEGRQRAQLRRVRRLRPGGQCPRMVLERARGRPGDTGRRLGRSRLHAREHHASPGLRSIAEKRVPLHAAGRWRAGPGEGVRAHPAGVGSSGTTRRRPPWTRRSLPPIGSSTRTTRSRWMRAPKRESRGPSGSGRGCRSRRPTAESVSSPRSSFPSASGLRIRSSSISPARRR